MERLLHEARETFVALFVVACLAAGIGGVVFHTLGPEGWLVEWVRGLLRDPNLATLAGLVVVIALLTAVKRLLDRHAAHPVLNNLLVGAVGLGGFVIILRGLSTVVG